MSAMTINKDNFSKEVLENEKLVLVDFYADWCMPCKMMAPIIDELADTETSVTIGKLNVDENPELAEKYKVMSIPTLLIFKSGEEVAKLQGAHSKSDLLDKINEFK